MVTYIGNNHDNVKGDDSCAKVIKIRVVLSQPLMVHAGQYINLWMRSVDW